MGKRPAPERSTGGMIIFVSRKMRLCLASAVILFITVTAIAQDPSSPCQDCTPAEIRLILRLKSNDVEQKRDALFEIRNLRTEKASRLAIPALSDSNEIVRATAAASVVFLPPAEAVQVLSPLLSDKKPFVRREAAYALGRVGDLSATNSLLSVLDKDRDLEVRAAAAVALGNIDDPSALDALTRLLQKRPDEDEEFIRRSAARSVGQIFEGDKKPFTVTPQNFLPPAFKETGESKTTLQIANLDSVIRTLSQVLQNAKEADDTRREAAFALGAIRQPASAAILRSYLNGPDPYLAEISKEALLKIENR